MQEAFKELLKAPQNQRILEKHVRKATNKSARNIRRRIKQYLRSSVPPPNSTLTLALKSGSRTMIETGELVRSVVVRQASWDRAFIGTEKADPAFNYGIVVNNGKVMPVTDRMRGLFFMLWVASRAYQRGEQVPELNGRALELFSKFKDWYPISKDKRAIVIPPRPYAKPIFEDRKVVLMVKANWEEAVGGAFMEVMKRAEAKKGAKSANT